MASALAQEEGRAVAKKDVDEGHGNGSALGRSARHRVMRPDVAELLQGSCDRQAKKETAPAARAAKGKAWVGRARYDCVYEQEEEDEEGLPAPPRLVWAKVRGHPWWPAQVFDPADASALALGERRKRGSALVANFWERTFAWETDAAALRPFRDGFSRLASVGGAHVPRWGARATMSPFASAVDAALGEVARRVDAGLSCDCRAICCAAAKKQPIDNPGIREGAHGAVVDAAFARDAFRGEAFVEYLSALAVAPLDGADRLELTVATEQLRAFTRWRGARGLPVYTVRYGIPDVADGTVEATPARRGRASATAKRRRPSGDSADGKSRCVTCGRARESVEDALDLDKYEPTPQPVSHETTTKMGKLMSQAARRMSLSPVTQGSADPPAKAGAKMTRCTRAAAAADHTTTAAPPAELQNGDLNTNKDEPLLTGLLLNFTGPNDVPPVSELVSIFSRFGPVVEARPEGFSVAVVVFLRSVDAEAAFSGTAKIGALIPKLISYRLAYSLSASAPVGSPQTPVNTHGMALMDLLDLAIEALE